MLRRFLQSFRCKHPVKERLCLHGDAIHHAGGNRAVCRRCGRFLPDLPHICSYTKEPHFRSEVKALIYERSSGAYVMCLFGGGIEAKGYKFKNFFVLMKG